MQAQTLQTNFPCKYPGCGLTVTGQINRSTGEIVCPVGHSVNSKPVTVGDLYSFLRQMNPQANLEGVSVTMRRMCDSCHGTLNKGDTFYECQDCGGPGFDTCQKCVDNPPNTLIEGPLQHSVLHRTVKRVHGQNGH